MYLSSYRLGRHADLLRSPSGNGRAAIVFNALDAFGETRLRNWDREASDLARLGYGSEELDLRQYVSNPAGLARRLGTLELVWVVGGNSFVLARVMTASGFERLLGPAMAEGMMYAGYSAGACVAGPDLRGIHLMDDPDDVPDGYDAGASADTLGRIPFRIVPHWRSDHPETERAEEAVRWLEQHSLDYRAIRDGDVVIVGDDGGVEVRS
jgi:dipeptidase E